MTLITSTSMKGAIEPMSDRKIASEDIIRVNEAGQHVVVVPKGQPVPDGVEETRAKKVDAPAENKAKRAPRKS